MSIDDILNNLAENDKQRLNKYIEQISHKSDYYKSMFFDNADDAIFTKNKELIFTSANYAMKDLLGLTPEELVGKKSQDFFDTKEANNAEALDRLVLKGESIKVVEYKTVEGIRKCISIIKKPIRNTNGEITGLVGYVRDISKYNRDKEEKIKLKNELELIFDNLPAMVFFKDKENRYVKVNDFYLENLGLERDQVEGRSAFDIATNSSLADRYWQDDLKIIENKTPKRNIVEPFIVDELRWFRTDKIPIISRDGTVKGILGFSIDITEQKQSEEKIQFQDYLLDHSRDAIIAINLDGQIVYWGKAAERLYGMTSEEAVGKNFDIILPYEDQKRVFDIIGQTIHEGEIQFETIHHNLLGEHFPAEISLNSVIDKSGHSVGLVIIVRDISDKIEIIEKLNNYKTRFTVINELSQDIFFSTLENSSGDYWITSSQKYLNGMQEIYTLRDFIEIIHPLDKQRIINLLNPQTIESTIQDKFKITDSDNIEHEMEILIKPQFSKNGKELLRISGLIQKTN